MNRKHLVLSVSFSVAILISIIVLLHKKKPMAALRIDTISYPGNEIVLHFAASADGTNWITNALVERIPIHATSEVSFTTNIPAILFNNSIKYLK